MLPITQYQNLLDNVSDDITKLTSQSKSVTDPARLKTLDKELVLLSALMKSLMKVINHYKGLQAEAGGGKPRLML